MSLTSLLLNHPISRESIELGRLVLDPKYPDQDFCQPSFPADPSDQSLDATNPITPSFIPDVATQRVENFHEVLQRTRGTRLELSLLNLLSVAPSAPTSFSTTVTATHCVTHHLRNATAYFSAACRQTNVRAWLDKESRRPSSTVYLVCGIKILIDARVDLDRHRETNLGVTASLPAALIASAAGVPAPIPLDSGLDISGSVSLAKESNEEVGYTAIGEQVFAVQYRKIHFSWFSTHKVDKAYLAKGNRWKSYLAVRAGQAGGDANDGVDAEVADPLALPDLIGTYECSELDGEQILYRVN
ncbi:hypothetical protein VN97_g9786 [Penicillium thymicola]|uniref:Uncharacterized protein n=1 Tax=Penicillium thymicola TaxID=293382 RepID=A0AAI9X4D7_PENTH|nr:hypothetical protein VN97_g9786 [Penicillium thymicola]